MTKTSISSREALCSAKTGALLLAGGEGRRMQGADKGTLLVHGQTCAARLVRTLKTQCLHVAISIGKAEKASHYRSFGCPLLVDGYQDLGPLSGLLAGLQWAQREGLQALMTVPVDTPFIPEDLFYHLWPPTSFARFGDRDHFLVALWSVDLVASLSAHMRSIAAGHARHKGRVNEILKSACARSVDFTPLWERDPFVNINTPDDWQAAASSPIPRRCGPVLS